MELSQLLNLVDWNKVMKASRSAGGHTDVMEKIFYDNVAVVLASWIEDDYQGHEVYAYIFKDGYVAVIQDSFGSCSGCDSYENCDDTDLKHLITVLVDSARIYKDISAALEYINKPDEGDYFAQYLVNVKNDLIKYNDIYKKIILDEAPLYINDKDKVVQFLSGVILGFIK